jgi:hypothetical protein
VTLELFKLLVPVLGKTVKHVDDMKAFCKRKSQGSIATFVCSMQGGILDLSLTHITDAGTWIFRTMLSIESSMNYRLSHRPTPSCLLLHCLLLHYI